jgi:phage recombination protein Bet
MSNLALRTEFPQDQIDLIRKQVAPAGTTNDELALFLRYAQQTGLDPFSRQIYLSERRSSVNGQWVVTRKPEVTIDGFRLIAERTQQYAGQLGPFWCGHDGQWVDVWLADAPPAAAKLGIVRHDFKEPLWSVALYREYAQLNKEGRPNSMWAKYPSVMLAKCAESLALRRAFPRELAGLYTREEMPEEKADATQAAQDVAQQRIQHLAAPKVAPEVIQDLAATLDRVSPLAADFANEPEEPKAAVKRTPKPKVSSALSFDVLGTFREVKTLMHAIDPTDAAYYGVLEQHGFKKSNEIPDTDTARLVYKSLVAAHKSLKTNAANRAEVQDIAQQMGADAFWTYAGTVGIDPEALENLTGDALLRFLADLRAEFESRKVKA